MLEARLPGVRFESRLRPVAEDLPRMDIAAFIGFAAAGPLHLPVAVEDPTRFREVFGADPPLAWDAEAGRERYGTLGGTVESFFANGGRRCWIVRVADAAAAVRHRFPLAGLAVGDDEGDSVDGVEARARAVGSWCEDLTVGAALVREVLPLRRFEVEDEEGPDSIPVELVAGGYRLDLVIDPTALAPGELVELFFAAELPRLWLFVDRVEDMPGFVRVFGEDRQNGDHTLGAYWVEPVSIASPPTGAVSQELKTVSEATALAELGAAGVLAKLATWPADDALEVVSARRLRLDLGLWRGSGLVERLGDLGLARRHPRCWARLATDEALFGSPSGSRRERLPEKLDAEVTSPRFALAGPMDDLEKLPRFYLPLRVRDRLDPELAAGPAEAAGTRLERDGLAEFDSRLFVDPALASLRGSVLTEAEHRYYVQERELNGFHGLLPVAEASLIAVPDACHSGWTRQLPPATEQLGAPELLPIERREEGPGWDLDWTPVDGATGYLVVRDGDPDFPGSVVVYDGEDVGATLYLEPGCPEVFYLRVRARRFGEVGPWSNTRRQVLPEPEFSACEGRPPAELRLELEIDGSPPGRRLEWEAFAGGPPAVGEFEIEEATNAGFVGAESKPTGGTEMGLPERPEARRYYRVRGLAGEERGPWSNTVVVEPVDRVNWTVLPAAEYDDAVLLAVHRALLRFAAARADLLAVLSLPPHYRAAEAALHVGRLTPGSDERLAGIAAASGVPPLSFGESKVLSYGTVVHPWLTVRIPDRGVEREEVTVELPPDGAVVGSMAAVALDRGAWLAPANRVLERVLALEPSLGLRDWRRLVPLRVNLVLQRPEGFLLLSEETLSRGGDTTAVHVRRLLILLRRLALREGDRFVFEPHDANLRHLVRHRFESILADLYSRGAFAGADPAAAFRVVADDSINPPASVERGRFLIELQVAPAQALTFITVRLVADERGRLTVEEA